MQASISSSRRHRPERKRPSGGGGSNSSAGRLWRLVAVLAVAVAWTRPSSLLAEAACMDGLEGILSDDGTICCLAACGQCGGSGCSDIAGTEDTDCCTADIGNSGLVCGVNGVVAPCNIDETLTATTAPSPATATAQPSAQPVAGTVPPPTGQPTLTSATDTPIAAATPLPVAAAVTTAPAPVAMPTPAPAVAGTPPPTTAPVAAAPTLAPVTTTTAPITGVSSTCDNGYPGWQTQEACCSDFCGQCGGSGCGTLGSADCCVDNIMNAQLVCGLDIFEAPCIVPVLQDGETYAPVGAPTPTPSPTPPITTVATLSPEGSATLAPSGSREIVDGVTEAPSAAGSGNDTDATGTPAVPPTSAPAGTSSPLGTPAPTAPECADGIEGFAHDVVCCPVACGQCGGSGCENIEGTAGASDCCSDMILISGQTCSDTGGVSPCILGAADALSGAAVEEETSSARSSTRMHVVAGDGRGVACAFAALCVAGFAIFNQL